ncbi:hypothetical protein Tco_0873793 [Tanacetum coccineum]|uniref:Uncharacterized protein n=1 Tax=Tanacetum coccineum TaxID=301880 RepID=A0ABQ5BMS1_9ASTR
MWRIGASRGLLGDLFRGLVALLLRLRSPLGNIVWALEARIGVAMAHASWVQNTPYCLEEQIRFLDCKDQYVFLSRRVDTSYPAGGYSVSVDLSKHDT